MEVLSSRVLVRPSDLDRSVDFYGNVLGLAVYREFGSGNSRGVVFFLGGGFLEVSGRSAATASAGWSGYGIGLWLQVRDLVSTSVELEERGVKILRSPVQEPWGLKEMWIADPDGLPIAVVEVPEDHPLRRR